MEIDDIDFAINYYATLMHKTEKEDLTHSYRQEIEKLKLQGESCLKRDNKNGN